VLTLASGAGSTGGKKLISKKKKCFRDKKKNYHD
jgi:hypothetical protein